MRLNGPRRKSRDTDGNDITGSNGFDEQVEARLRDAAGFEPDEEPAYDFDAVALRHRRAPRAALAGLALTGLAGMSAALILAVVATLIARGQTDAGAGLIPTPKGYDGTTAARSAGLSGTAAIAAAKQEERADVAPTPPAARRAGGAARQQLAQDEQGEQGEDAATDPGAGIELARMAANGARRRAHRRGAPAQAEDAPEVHWQTESVQRYTTGVLTSGWVLHQDGGHGEVTATPVTLDVPLRTGEAPLSDAAGDKPAPPSLTFTSADGGRP